MDTRARNLCLAVGFLAAVASGAAPDGPEWWRETRAIYTPAACTGAGSNLMKFYGCPGALDEAIDSFAELPRLLPDGCNVLYLVDYWEGGYSAKGTYEPAADLGGVEAFQGAIEEIHASGDRIILYVEPFILSRKTPFGKAMGPVWAMMDEGGRYYDYPGTRNEFYLLQPRSGWADHLELVCRRLVGEYGADGIFLDSYGCQAGWRDHHPDHPGADADGWFDTGVVELARRIRAAVRDENPEAVVITECDVQAALNAVTDGALEESLATLKRLEWYRAGGTHKLFLSEFSLARMEKIVGRGFGVALNPWWYAFDRPADRDFDDWMEVEMDLGENRRKAQRAMREFVEVHNYLYANRHELADGRALPESIDFEHLLRQTIPFTCDRLEITTEERTRRFRAAVTAARARVATLDPATAVTPGEYLTRLLQ